MRILSVNTMDRSGGAEKVASDLVARFRESGIPTTFAGGRKRGGIADIEFPQDQEYLPKNDIAPKPADTTQRNEEYSSGTEDFNFPGTWDLLSFASERYDLLHLHNLHGGYFDLRALPWLSHQIPTVMTLHDAWLTSGHCAHSIDCKRWQQGCGECPDLDIYPSIQADNTAFNWNRKVQIISDSRLHIVTPSNWLMDKFRASILWPHFLSKNVIPNGVDNSIYYSGSKDEARDLLNLPVNSVILLSVFNVIKNNPFKDFDASLRIVNWLSKRHTDQPVYWICIGSKGPNTEVGNATAIFVPYQDNEDVLATFYRAADIFLHIALADTFPNVVLEALSCGCPVASTSVGGIPEQIKSIFPVLDEKHGDFDETTATGLIVRPGDERELVNQLSYLLDTPDLLLKLSCNAAEEGILRFNESKTTKSYIECFSKILDDQSVSYQEQKKTSHKDEKNKTLYKGNKTKINIQNAPLILMYHRVTEIPLDPQLLTVKPSTFEEHLNLISQISEPINLGQMIESIDSGDIPWDTISITFDDGYADNFLEAFPLLSKNNVPATVFSVSGAINNKKEFWWDHLEYILLTPGTLPSTANLEIGNKSIILDLGKFTEYTEEDVVKFAEWTVLDTNDPTPRHTLYRHLYRILRSIQNFKDRSSCLDLINNWAKKEPQRRESHRTLTFDEIKTMGNSDIVDIGAHTASHPVLSSMSPADQEAEITSGRKALEDVVGQPINVFAYPYGDQLSYTKETTEILEKNAFKGAVTTLNAGIDKNSKIFELPRITIRECTPNQLLEKLTYYRQ